MMGCRLCVLGVLCPSLNQGLQVLWCGAAISAVRGRWWMSFRGRWLGCRLPLRARGRRRGLGRWGLLMLWWRRPDDGVVAWWVGCALCRCEIILKTNTIQRSRFVINCMQTLCFKSM